MLWNRYIGSLGTVCRSLFGLWRPVSCHLCQAGSVVATVMSHPSEPCSRAELATEAAAKNATPFKAIACNSFRPMNSIGLQNLHLATISLQ